MPIFKLDLSGYRHTTISLICMNTRKALAARCLITKLHLGNLPSGHCHSPFKKDRPKRALHYRDYQLPDHLYSLREIFNKRHMPMQTYIV